MTFATEKDLALCGLACVLCSQEDCPGCKARGCNEGSDCSVFLCATKRGLDGCYACEAFPCKEPMLQGIRNRAFNRYAQRYGKPVLLERLRINFGNGIAYHKPGGLKGDYDQFSTEPEILRLIHFGLSDPYQKCPIIESESFFLRLVQLEDAEDLLACYSDPKAQEIFNADKCTSDFRYQTAEQMRECILFWLDAHEKRYFIRFSIVDKISRRAIGTVEMFGYDGEWQSDLGVLRLDISSAYEERARISELLALCTDAFAMLFASKRIVTKAIPVAKERIAALKSMGYRSFDWPELGRAHYWAYEV